MTQTVIHFKRKCVEFDEIQPAPPAPQNVLAMLGYWCHSLRIIDDHDGI